MLIVPIGSSSSYPTSLVLFSTVSSLVIFIARQRLMHHTVMEIAVLLSAGLREWIDFGVIIAILLLNAGVGWYQEKQAADVVASLKETLPCALQLYARVRNPKSKRGNWYLVIS